MTTASAKTPSPPPALSFAPELLLLAQGVRAAIFDVDGVLTDGALYYSDQGEAIKRFCTLDGHGIKLLQQAGITPVVISGRDSQALRSRLAGLGVTQLRCAVADKRAAAEEIFQSLGVSWGECAAIGDDWPDLPLLARCKLACAPPGAHVEVRARAHYVTQAAGGFGAAREFCDLLLVASGRYAQLLQDAQP